MGIDALIVCCWLSAHIRVVFGGFDGPLLVVCLLIDLVLHILLILFMLFICVCSGCVFIVFGFVCVIV